MRPPSPGRLTAPATPERRLYEIDLLRFLAAIMVVLVHLSCGGRLGVTRIDYSDSVGRVGRYGYLGVDLFFMISGLVVFMSLWGRTPGAFVVSRVSRLYPAFWAGVTTTSLVLLSGAVTRPAPTLRDYLVNLTMFAQPLDVPVVEGVYWTLWAEWRFYFLLFAFSLIGITLGRTHVFLWGWLVATLLVEVLPLPYAVGHPIELVLQPVYSHYFIAGMALYLVHRSGFTANRAALLAVAYGNALHQGVQHAAERSRQLVPLQPAVVVAVITAFFLVMILVATGALARFGSRSWKPVGDLTYPLYLVHATVGYAVLNVFGSAVNRWLLLGCLVVGLCLLAWAMNRLVEVPLQPRLRRALTRILDHRSEWWHALARRWVTDRSGVAARRTATGQRPPGQKATPAVRLDDPTRTPGPRL
ncbi:acyltransferase family protein [Micromonospora zhanjiangensis]